MKLGHFTTPVFGILLVAGCAGKSVTVSNRQDLPQLVGKRVTMVGIAMHSCPGAMVFNKNFQVYIDGMKYWPTNYDRRQIEVTGLLGEQHGPDLYVIHAAQWSLLQ